MSSPSNWSLENLPGGRRIKLGLADRAAGLEGINACLVRIAAPRLRRAGLLREENIPDATAELDLYQILLREPGDPYSRYNALLRELVSFEHALDQCLSSHT